MRFLRRNIYLLLFCAVLFLSSVLVVHQHISNLSAHTERREDFIALHQMGHAKPAEHLYQVLIQTFPRLSDSALWQDVDRTTMLVDAKTPQPESLVWKYHISVKNELARRTQHRITRVLEQSKQ
jgi:hypothetical protein